MPEKIEEVIPQNEAETNEEASGGKIERSQEKIEAMKDGIRKRLNDWQRKDIYSLRDHLTKVLIRGLGQKTFRQAYDEMLECCKEGTEEGRTWRNEKGEKRAWTAKDPSAAAASLIEKLPWVVNHDDLELGFQAEDSITVEELLEIAEGIVK